MKPFRAYLAEQEQDYEYKLCSVENIHTNEMVQKIHLALDRYGLISMEPTGVQTTAKDTANSQFAEYPFMSVFITTVVLANPLSSDAAVQSIALFTNIKDKKIQFFDKDDKIVMDGADAEQHAHPVEVDSKGSQEEVGDLRATRLVGDVMKDIITRRAATTIERDVYEGFVASHHEVKAMVGQSVSRGFYLVERFDDSTGLITGPFDKCPNNYDYIGHLPPTTVLVEAVSTGDIMEYQVQYPEAESQDDPADGGDRMVGKSMSVDVTDQDTGTVHTVVVRTTSSDAARKRAIEILSARTGISKERLIPVKPDAVKESENVGDISHAVNAAKQYASQVFSNAGREDLGKSYMRRLDAIATYMKRKSLTPTEATFINQDMWITIDEPISDVYDEIVSLFTDTLQLATSDVAVSSENPNEFGFLIDPKRYIEYH